MRILQNIIIPSAFKQNQLVDSQYSSTVLRESNTDALSFRASAKNAEPLRALMYYGVPGLYSAKYVIPRETVDTMIDNHVFSKTIRLIVKAIKPYEDRLLDVESQFFELVKQFAKSNPNYKLSDVVQNLKPRFKEQLTEEQFKVLGKLSNLGQAMPEKQQKKFDALMDLAYKKINEVPVLIPYNSNEFMNSLQDYASDFSKKHKHQEFIVMLKIMHLASKMPASSEAEIDNIDVPKTKQNKKAKIYKNQTRTRAELLNKIELLAAESPLKDNSNFMQLLLQTRAKIYSLPILMPFDRQDFIEEVKNLTKTLKDKNLAKDINETVIQLPNRHENLAAFIIEATKFPSSKIGYNMVEGAIGNIDHLLARSVGGKDCIENYAITSSYFNSARGHRPLLEQFTEHPESYNTFSIHINRLIELCNKGIFKKVGLPKHYIPNLAKLLSDNSPKEKPFEYNLDKLV